ncbi:uncharacterized protein B0T23DRAFT_397175 [Neurospora hispaniola]|uniref:Uncharacterized protein n=1 Tax=Neurospora hispaniola TaxID=588809 RepID=A0AAJ0I6Q1_9PEZI|nr:hypothetical protein B0T23DRAFT_397175 [Neurospora hispaniola]
MALKHSDDDIQDSQGHHNVDDNVEPQGPTSTLENNTPTTTTTTITPSVEVQQVSSPAQSPRSPALSQATAPFSTATPITMATTPSSSVADQTCAAPLGANTVPGDHDGNQQQLGLERDPPIRLLSPAGITRRASSTSSSIRTDGSSASNTPLTAGAQAAVPLPIPALAELAARGATTVSYMVQSYEALRAARIAAGYDMVQQVSSKASGSQLGVSPSPSPSPSPSGSRSPSIVQIPNQQDNDRSTAAIVPGDDYTNNRQDSGRDGAAANNKQYDIDDPSPDSNERGSQLRPVPQQQQQQQPTAAAVTTGDHSFSRSISDNHQHEHDLSAPLNSFSLPPPPPSDPSAVVGATTAVANTTVVRPTPESPKVQRSRSSTVALQQTPPPRTSSTASIPLSHPTPDTSKRSRSGAYVGNIAALEATAERFSLTSSIEEAIRNEHNELKRSDSRRSAILQATKSPTSDTASSPIRSRVSSSRTNSIRALNSAARLGGYSPGGYVMTPNHSLSGGAHSGSKPGSIGESSPRSPPAETAANAQNPDFIGAGTGEEFPFARHGPGKSSVRDASRKPDSLAQIAELDHPITITQDAIDEADRAAATGAALDDDEAIAARAHQQIEPQYADEMDDVDLNGPDEPVRQPMLDNTFFDQPGPRLQLHQPVDYPPYEDHDAHQQYHGRPLTAASRTTLQQANDAFGDFDGVHCDPDVDHFAGLPQPAERAPEPRRRRETLQPRPKSYFDPSTGQEMLYYPAPVPAMLNLPPKLSKNTNKAGGARNMRRSQVLSVMQQQSSVYGGSRDNLPMMSGGAGEAPPQLPQIDGLPYADGPADTAGAFPAQSGREIRRPQRLTETDRRKSQATMLNGLPPQLRASAFFDLPTSTTPHIQLKDGSATATLETILDASATAPVSAFTDHAYGGKLGPEVYGTDKKKIQKSVTSADIPTAPVKKTRKKLIKRNSSSGLLDVKANKDSDEDEGWTSPSAITRDGPGGGEEEEELVDGEPVFNGPPTTLLAELQMRKQKDKMLRRPAAPGNPYGMHATLLELDAVAQVQRKQRITKRVNLAWEDPAQNPTPESDDEDVPLGMLYAAKAAGVKDPHTADIAVLMSEVNRPLGLMERRELEENEPLSQRRHRLKGSESLPSMSLDQMQRRMSHMTLTPSGGPNALGNRSQSKLTLPLPRGLAGGSNPALMAGGLDAEGSDAEGEGETLAARKARLAAENPLPRARPVSAGFSSELLSEFGVTPNEEEKRPTSKDSKGKAPASGVPEEEETLGQRRKRLQAEREAREREMAAGALPGNATQIATNPNMLAAPPQPRDRRDSATLIPFDPNNVNPGPPSRRVSLSDVLNAHPVDSTGLGNPHISPLEQERLRREAEGLRQQRAQEAKMAAIRAQMPQTLAAPAIGARTGGFMGGIYNGGGAGANRSNPALGQGLGIGFDPNANAIQPRGLLVQQHEMEKPMARRASTMTVGGGAAGAQYGMGMGMPMMGAVSNYGAYGAPMQFQTGPGQMMRPQMGMMYPHQQQQQQQLPQQPGGVDMVERWRQSVMP